jgi:hypothetical protein
MTRFENSVGRRDLIRLFHAFLDALLNSHAAAPECMAIDMDPRVNRVYGDQQMALCNAHCDEYCLMPFHVTEGITGRLVATVLRPGKTPTKEDILALLKRIVRRIRARCPHTTLIFRADSHHTKPEVLDWLEDNGVRYVLGLATNAVLRREVEPMLSRRPHHPRGMAPVPPVPLLRDRRRAAPAVVTHGGKGECAQILPFPAAEPIPPAERAARPLPLSLINQPKRAVRPLRG